MRRQNYAIERWEEDVGVINAEKGCSSSRASSSINKNERSELDATKTPGERGARESGRVKGQFYAIKLSQEGWHIR